MDFLDALRLKVKPELNHIYTEKPFIAHGGRDLGWFCREHSLHLYVLAKLLGYTANICVGDFFLYLSPDKIKYSSLGDDSDHAWCSINQISPVDISITVKYLSEGSPDIPLVYGTSVLSENPYRIYYFINADDEMIKKPNSHGDPFIAYNEKETLEYDPIDLLNNPFNFLHPPPAGSPSFIDLHGDDIFHRITYHCYLLITKGNKPFYTYRNPEDTLKGIIKFNKTAKEQVEALLHSRI